MIGELSRWACVIVTGGAGMAVVTHQSLDVTRPDVVPPAAVGAVASSRTAPPESVLTQVGRNAEEPPDPADPGTASCLAAGGRPAPPLLGGGGGPGSPVNACRIGGHLWYPGGEHGAPWGVTVHTDAECRLIGGVFRVAVDPDGLPTGFNCVH